MRRQDRDEARRTEVRFQMPGGKLGEDLEVFFEHCAERQQRYAIPISEFCFCFCECVVVVVVAVVV